MDGKRLLQHFVVTLVAVAVALLVYDHFRQPDIRAARQQTAALAAQTEDLHNQATALSEKASALESQVSEQRRKAAERKDKYLTASYRASGLADAGSFRTAVVEYYFTHGEFPASNEQARLQAPEEYGSRALRAMAISKGGVITLTYDARSGVDGGTIQLIPEAGHSGGPRWTCVTSDFAYIAETIPQCSYSE